MTAKCTGIGSLPHQSIDAAIEHSFKMDMPFVPQLPQRNPKEYMIPQAIHGLPGLETASDGWTTILHGKWEAAAAGFDARLDAALAGDFAALGSFEPLPDFFSCWKPFLWEISERKTGTAKCQIAGPLTVQLSFPKNPALASQICKLVTVRALAMTTAIRRAGALPVVFIDEPALHTLDPGDHNFALAIHELAALMSLLSAGGTLAGIHCCGNTDWDRVISAGPAIISLDTAESLDAVMRASQFDSFLQKGGTIAFGIIPLSNPGRDAALLFKDFVGRIKDKHPALARNSIFSPACGLSLQSVPEAEHILETLVRFTALCNQTAP
ncbi:MAG: hypothetical protein A2583_15335 [Bdellovibrionales bacterium RIFOXYD1_FULL_53_11]|nr:MAG: hypothetical protein A2583_15335 [Bdellovibrionales bacterium RIFOXYD1_FULL_53_11]